MLLGVLTAGVLVVFKRVRLDDATELQEEGALNPAGLERTNFEEQAPSVEPATIILILGLASICFAGVSSAGNLTVKLLAFLAFALSSFGAGILFSVLMFDRVPVSRNYFPYKLLARFIKLFIKEFGTKVVLSERVELGYYCALASFALLWVVALIWATMDLLGL